MLIILRRQSTNFFLTIGPIPPVGTESKTAVEIAHKYGGGGE